MCDRVSDNLETLLPGLLDLIKRDIFTLDEVRVAMETRRNQEFKLLKDPVQAADYLSMIEFEYEQERLRRQKMAQLTLFPKASDGLLRKRITQIWARCTFKFKYRIDLWQQFLAFCYTIGNRNLFQRIVARALRFNPTNMQLWLTAVYFTLQVLKNPLKARNTFLVALQKNEKDVMLWREFVMFEMKMGGNKVEGNNEESQQVLKLSFEQQQLEQKKSSHDWKNSLQKLATFLKDKFATDCYQTHFQPLLNPHHLSQDPSPPQPSFKTEQQSPIQNYQQFITHLKTNSQNIHHALQRAISSGLELTTSQQKQFTEFFLNRKIAKSEAACTLHLAVQLLEEPLAFTLIENMLVKCCLHPNHQATIFLQLNLLRSRVSELLSFMLAKKINFCGEAVAFFIRQKKEANLSRHDLERAISRIGTKPVGDDGLLVICKFYQEEKMHQKAVYFGQQVKSKKVELRQILQGRF